MNAPATALHRAIVMSHRHNGAEVVVFFEVPAVLGYTPVLYLEQALATVWQCSVTDLEITNCNTEEELLGIYAFGDESTGDLRLFETGYWHNAPIYATADETLLLVSPARLKRLVAAQRRLPIIVVDEVTAPMPLAA